MGQVVIVAYKPKQGMANALKALTAMHVPRLRELKLATDRAPVIVETADGIIIEIFEWISKEAIQQAHNNTAVHQMWAEYAEVCDYVPLNTLSEAAELFAAFTPVD